jgi:hypothetical protein
LNCEYGQFPAFTKTVNYLEFFSVGRVERLKNAIGMRFDTLSRVVGVLRKLPHLFGLNTYALETLSSVSYLGMQTCNLRAQIEQRTDAERH